MALPSWLRHLILTSPQSARRSQRPLRRRPARSRPLVEQLEDRTLLSNAPFQSFLLHAATGLPETDDRWSFDTADWGMDSGRPDLFAINRQSNDNPTEVHILSGADDYQDFHWPRHIQTGLHQTSADWSFAMADWDGGRPDLVAVNRWGASGFTEVHILSGDSNFQEFVEDKATALHRTDSTWQFEMTDWDGDSYPDLVAIQQGPNFSHTTEVHILSGKTNFQTFLLHAPTGLHETDANWAFDVVDWDRRGKADLVAVRRTGTGTGTTEVHVLSGESGFGQFILHTDTGLQETDSNFDFELVSWADNASLDLLAVQKSGTATDLMEVHILSSAPAARTLDSDGDGILNLWEVAGLDVNEDDTVDLDLRALGADPYRKDIFVEVDAMSADLDGDGRLTVLNEAVAKVDYNGDGVIKGQVNENLAPTANALKRVRDAFAAAPVANPKGPTGITLHASLDKGDIPIAAWPNFWTEFDAIKAKHFGTQAQRDSSNWANIWDALKKVYRYCVFAHSYGGTDSSGLGEMPGNDFMVTLGRWDVPGGTEDQQAGTFMHELGHNLGLDHGGGDDTNLKPNYHSVMNYLWQKPQEGYKTSWRLDYSRERMPDLDENNLDEAAGIGGHAGHSVPVGPLNPLTLNPVVVSESGPVDWNRDGDKSDTGVVADIRQASNDTGAVASPGEILKGHEDWSALRYSFAGSANAADGVHPEDTAHDEMTFQIFQQLNLNNAPEVTWVDDRTVDEGSALSFVVTATDFDDDGLTFSLGSAPAGAHIDPASGLFTWTPGEGPATVTVTVRVTDNGSPILSHSQTFSISVRNVPPVVHLDPFLTAAEGGLLSVPGSFTDPGADTYTATVDYGDGWGTQPLPLSGAKTFTLMHTYADSGTYPVTVTVTDDDGGLGSTNSLVTVHNVAPTLTLPGSSFADEGIPYALTLGAVIDPGQDTVSAYKIHWGDGATSSVPAAALPANRTLQHVYAAGTTSRTIMVDLTDEDGSYSAVTSKVVTVKNVAPAVNAGGAIAINQGGTLPPFESFTDAGSDVWSATVDYGEGSGVQALALGTDKTLRFSHVYNDSGDYTVTVTVSDGEDTGSDTLAVHVYVGGVVTNTNDSGLGSLRQAILDENSHAGPDPITFAIPGPGPHVIHVLTPLTAIIDAIAIDATTQPGYAGSPVVQLDGSGLSSPGTGLNMYAYGGTSASGSSIRGLSITGFDAAIGLTRISNVWIAGNYIGVAPDGNTAGGGQTNGVAIGGATDVTIGTDGDGVGDVAERNLISGNAGMGIRIEGGAANITMQGNYIGTDATGEHAVANGTWFGGGIGTYWGASYLQILDNLISGNVGFGVHLYPDAHHVTIQGNRVGTNAAGTVAVGNSYGIFMEYDIHDVLVGGTTPGTGNLVSGNSGTGIWVSHGTHGITIQGNRVGTDVTGTYAIPNTHGVALNGGDHRVGGTAEGAGNLISGNLASGVSVAENTGPVWIEGNLIGTDVTGVYAIGNGDGVNLRAASTVTIGGTTAAARNVISGNTANGVVIANLNPTDHDNVVRGNYIGTNATGANRVPNQVGVAIFNASNSTIVGNVISGNNGPGVALTIATNVIIQGNKIGTNPTGTAKVANTGDGIVMPGADTGITIGGTGAGEGNLISGNTGHGVFLQSGDNTGNTIVGNRIGTRADGMTVLGNSGAGVYIYQGLNNTITGNLVSGNTQGGVAVVRFNATGNVVNGNTIGLAADGLTARGNNGDGVLVTGATGTVVDGNIIASNGGDGIEVSNGATGTVITRNTIGMAANGNTARGNVVHGVNINNSPRTVIGGSGVGNVIGGNAQNGVFLDGAGTTGAVVAGNTIGTDATGTFDRGNGINGVRFGNGAGGAMISGNLISGNNFSGINLVSSSNNVIVGNRIGTNAAGTGAVGNSGGSAAVTLQGSSTNNRIGGTTTAEGNLISGNNQAGVLLTGAGTSGNLIQGNYIGTDVNGTSDLGNSNDGVRIQSGASNNIITGNVISGNDVDGVEINSATGNRLTGNLIGTDATGILAIGNTNTAVFMPNAANSTIGGLSAADRNVISGSKLFHGIHLTGSGSQNNLVQGNLIGTDASGTLDLGNAQHGVVIDSGARNNTVGGTAVGARNVVSGNGQPGVFANGVVVAGSGTTGNLVAGNNVGTNAAGTAAVANSWDGVLVFSGATNNTVGGTTPAARNIISGNGLNGVEVSNAGTSNNVVLGNYVGLNAAGTAGLPNAFHGISVAFGATGNTVGGNAAGAGNVVSGNTASGIDLYHAGTSNNVVIGNWVGTDYTGTAAVGNGNGVTVGGGAANTTVAGNLISGNGFAGVGLFSGAGAGNVIDGNTVGLAADGDTSLGNGVFGVVVDAPGNTVGGSAGNTVAASPINDVIVTANGAGTVIANNLLGTDATGTQDRTNSLDVIFSQAPNVTITGNVIGGAQYGGIRLDGPAATGAVVAGNAIGTDRTGTIALGNGGAGVYLSGGTSGNRIGTDGAGVNDPAEANVIRNNGWVGVAVATGTDNRIRGNAISGNGSIGIDLNQDGVTPNDAGDADAGPNGLQNVPGIASFETGASTRVIGALSSTPNTTFTLDFYANTAIDSSGSGEGERYLGAATVTTDATGFAAFDVTLATATAAGELVTATATDPAGNTSEFSSRIPVAVPGGPYAVDEQGTVTLDASASYDPDLPWATLGYVWDLDGDGVLGETGAAAARGEEVGASPTFSAAGLDGPTSFTVHLAVIDVSGLVSPVASVVITVRNVAPVVDPITGSSLNLDVAGRPITLSGVRGQTLFFAGSFVDASPLDTHVIGWDFGDGTIIDFHPSTDSGALTPAHVYTGSGTYTITLTVRDDDGGTTAVSAPVTIQDVALQIDPLQAGQTVLAAGGTLGDDVVKFKKHGAAGAVEVSVNGVSYGPFTPTGRLLAFGQAGDDDLDAAAGLDVSAWLYGGAGADRLKGGGGADVLLGGEGDDVLKGGGGRDLLIGGVGADQLNGNADEDVLVAGYTSWDANELALMSLMQEWTSNRSYAQRVANLMAGTGPSGGYQLQGDDGEAQTVFNDNEQDVLTGAQGPNWFLANRVADNGGTLDVVTDWPDDELWSDTDF